MKTCTATHLECSGCRASVYGEDPADLVALEAHESVCVGLRRTTVPKRYDFDTNPPQLVRIQSKEDLRKFVGGNRMQFFTFESNAFAYEMQDWGDIPVAGESVQYPVTMQLEHNLITPVSEVTSRLSKELAGHEERAAEVRKRLEQHKELIADFEGF